MPMAFGCSWLFGSASWKIFTTKCQPWLRAMPSCNLTPKINHGFVFRRGPPFLRPLVGLKIKIKSSVLCNLETSFILRKILAANMAKHIRNPHGSSFGWSYSFWRVASLNLPNHQSSTVQSSSIIPKVVVEICSSYNHIISYSHMISLRKQ